MSENVKILVCAHKKDYVYGDSVYMPMHVGKALSDTDLGFCGDDTGDNISEKNQSYCELTAMYWAWKNLKGVDIIGFNHYRRYFDFRRRLNLKRKTYIHTSLPEFERYIEKGHRSIESLLGKADIIVGKPERLNRTLYQNYCISHISEDIRILRTVIHELAPDYDKAYRTVIHRRHLMSPCNMFICRWDVFDAYCAWLFPILEEVEKRVNIENYSTYQKRIFGFLSERLLNVYVYKNKLKKKTFPIFFIE